MSVKYCLPVPVFHFEGNQPTLQRGLSAIAELLVLYPLDEINPLSHPTLDLSSAVPSESVPVSLRYVIVYFARTSGLLMSSTAGLHAAGNTCMTNCSVMFTYNISKRELTFTYAICYRPSVRLSVCLSVTFVRRTQVTEIFGSVSTPFGTLAICDLSIKILRRSSQGTPPGRGVIPKRGS